MLRHLFLRQKSEQPHSRIREAWCFDWQNHGDAAVINKTALERRSSGHVCESMMQSLAALLMSTPAAGEWAAAIASFVRSPYVRDHRLVGFGHSAGSSAMSATLSLTLLIGADFCARVLSTQMFPLCKQPFIALFLIEPSMLTRELWESHLLEEEAGVRRRMSAALRRRHVFDTREEAAGYFQQLKPWSGFDPDVFNIFIVSKFNVYELQVIVFLATRSLLSRQAK